MTNAIEELVRAAKEAMRHMPVCPEFCRLAYALAAVEQQIMGDAEAARLGAEKVESEASRCVGNGLPSPTQPAQDVVMADPWGDKPDEYTADIKAAHPMKTGDHPTYVKAERMVHNRHSKYALVDLVNWLLTKAATQPTVTREEVVRVLYGEFPELLREQGTAHPPSPSVRALSFDEASEGGKSLARRQANALIAAGWLKVRG